MFLKSRPRPGLPSQEDLLGLAWHRVSDGQDGDTGKLYKRLSQAISARFLQCYSLWFIFLFTPWIDLFGIVFRLPINNNNSNLALQYQLSFETIHLIWFDLRFFLCFWVWWWSYHHGNQNAIIRISCFWRLDYFQDVEKLTIKSVRISWLTDWHCFLNDRKSHLLTRFGSSHPPKKASSPSFFVPHRFVKSLCHRIKTVVCTSHWGFSYH